MVTLIGGEIKVGYCPNLRSSRSLTSTQNLECWRNRGLLLDERLERCSWEVTAELIVSEVASLKWENTNDHEAEDHALPHLPLSHPHL